MVRTRQKRALPVMPPDRMTLRAFPWQNAGFEIQTPQPPHRRPERNAAIMLGDPGNEAKFSPPVATINYTFDSAALTAPRRPRSPSQASAPDFPTAVFRPMGWEIAPHQPQPRAPNSRGQALIGNVQFVSFTLFPFAFEIQAFQPNHPRPEKSGAQQWGDLGNEAKFIPTTTTVNFALDIPTLLRSISTAPRRAVTTGTSEFAIFPQFYPFGWEIAAVQPQHPRPEKAGAIMAGESGIEAKFVFAQTPIIWPYDVQPFQPSHPRPERSGAVARGDDGTQSPLTNFFPLGWPVQAHQPQHPRPERAGAIMFGEPGIEAIFVGVAPTPWGYEQPPINPRVRFERAGALARGEDGTEGTFVLWRNFGWEIQPVQPNHPRPERFGAVAPREDGVEFPLLRFLGFGFENQAPQPPHRRIERGAGFMRGDDGTEAPFVFVQTPIVWPYDLQAYQPQHVRFERAAAIARGDDGIQAQFANFFPDGWAVAPHQPSHPRPERAGAIMPGESGIEKPFIFTTIPIWAHQEPFLYPRKPVERRGAIMRGDDGTQDRFRRFFPSGWDPSEPVRRPRTGWHGPNPFSQAGDAFPAFQTPLWVDRSQSEQIIIRPRRGGAQAINTELEIVPFIPPLFQALDWWTPETFYRRRYTGAIMPWEGGWFMRRFVPVFYATSVITSATGKTAVTAAMAKTVIKGERQGQ